MTLTKYRTIVADPPWPEPLVGQFRVPGKRSTPPRLPYPTMTLEEIASLSVADLAEPSCHLWLWTTNRHLEQTFSVMRSWGFKYLSTITWVKDSGMGAYFATTTQHVLFGYREKCVFSQRRWAPTHFYANKPSVHSQKPEVFYGLVEEVSEGPRLELFARRNRLGWDTWGNEALEHVALTRSESPSGAVATPKDSGGGR